MKEGRGGRILVVDDEPNAVKVLSSIFAASGYEVHTAWDAEAAETVLSRNDVDAVITDVKMPGKDGIQLFENVSRDYPDIPVIFLTAYGTVESAVHTLSMGAFYYFTKPPDYAKLKTIVARAVEQRRLKRELGQLKVRLSEETGHRPIIGRTAALRRIMETVNAVKDSQSSVVITGETGTGKELIARTLHESSRRRDKPFVAVNCAAIPRDLLESELFGYEKGAFTGAASTRKGKFDEASGGTVFLDEISELEPSLHAKLLRVLQEREIERLGSNRRIKVNFRLVCSSNRNLKEEVRAGRFRADLFYRINVVELVLPPLRERRDDIPLLVSQFFKEFCARENKVLTLSGDAMRALVNYGWPGNIRQLKNVIERTVVLARGRDVTRKDLAKELRTKPRDLPKGGRTLRQIEMQAILDAMERCNGNKSKAARELGMSRKALYKRLNDAGGSEKHKISLKNQSVRQSARSGSIGNTLE
jgi:DNA-binding NtrC family response regulator